MGPDVKERGSRSRGLDAKSGFSAPRFVPTRPEDGPVISVRHQLSRLVAVGLSFAVSVATLALLAEALHPRQAAGSELRSGSFDLYRNGSRIGSESWSWATEASGSAVFTGQCSVELDGVSTTIQPKLTLDGATLTPIAYEFEQVQGDQVRRVSTTFDGGRVAQQIEENGMSSKRQLKIKPSDLVVNDDVLSQFLLVVERYDFEKGGTQDFTVFDIKSGRASVAKVMARGLGTVENGSGTFRVRRVTLSFDELLVDVYVDGRGQVPQISIPLRGIEARMPGYKGESKVESSGSGATPALGLRVSDR